MNTDNIRNKWDKYGKIALVGLGALVISPIIFMVVKGIVGLAIAGIVGLVVVNAAPVLSMKLANWKVKGIVSEAKENPIETMVNLLAEKKKAFDSFKIAVENAATAKKDFAQKCSQFSKKYPARAHEFEVQLAAMTQLVEKKVQALQDAKASIDLGYVKLDEMRAYWEMSQAAQEANAAAGMDTGDMYERLKADTAVDAVFESVNRAFAELEVAAALQEPRALENNPSEGITFSTVPTESKVKV